MARLARIVLPGHPHLLIHRGHSGQPVFLDLADQRAYIACLHDAAQAARVAVHGYSLHANEIRVLATPETPVGLAQLMQSVGRKYVPAFNKRHIRNGTPWEGRFRSTVIESGRHLLSCLRFVEASCEGASKSLPAPTPLTSAPHHLGQAIDPIVVDHPAFWALGNTPFEREAAYRRFIEEVPAQDELAAILLAALNGWVLGSPEFCSIVALQTGRRPRPTGRGRPRKIKASLALSI